MKRLSEVPRTRNQSAQARLFRAFRLRKSDTRASSRFRDSSMPKKRVGSSWPRRTLPKSRKETDETYIASIDSVVLGSWCDHFHWLRGLPANRQLPQRELPRSLRWLRLAQLWRLGLSGHSNRIPQLFGPLAKSYGPGWFRHSQRSGDGWIRLALAARGITGRKRSDGQASDGSQMLTAQTSFSS